MTKHEGLTPAKLFGLRHSCVIRHSSFVIRHSPALRSTWIGDYVDPNSFLDLWVRNGTNNQTGWSNAEYDRLIAEASRTGDQAARYATFQKAEAILLDEAAILPVYFYTHAFLIRPNVKGWYPTILDHHPYKYVRLE